MALNKRKTLEAARKYAQKGAKAKALREYNKLLKEGARDTKLLLEVGDAYRRWGQNEDAIAQYGKVADQYRQDGFDARAVAVFKQILNLDPKKYPAYVSLSELYQRMGLDSEAVGALQTAADGYHKEGRKAEALDLLRQMAALDPTNTTSRLKVAELLRQEGMESEAVDEYRAVIEELEGQQDRYLLVTVLERLLEVKPDNIDALTRLVRCFIETSEFQRADPLAVRALNVKADIPQYELLMDLYVQMGDEAKLADATRGLAAVYRDRGDDERARELTQRLPVDELGSSSRLAVDVSEVYEPDLGEDELLEDDDDFLSLDGDDSDLGVASDALDFSLTKDDTPALKLDSEEEADSLDLGNEPAPATVPEPEPESEAELPLPEGEPDQLLAEASVYLRYGKRDQAIARLKGILVQVSDHRAALEKLGEAYVDDGQTSEAVAVWMRAAKQMIASGDAEALSALKDRISTLDPAVAAQLGEFAAVGAPSTTNEAPSMVELDLDIEIDLDDAIAPGAGDDASDALGFGAETDDFEIELDDESITFGDPPVNETPEAENTSAASEKTADPTTPDFGDGAEFEFEVGDDGLSLYEETDTGDDVCVGFDSESEGLTEPSTGSSAGQSTTTAACISEELEEAEFYIAQLMYDEAERLLKRILDVVPSHPTALLRMGEVAAARSGEPDEAVSQAQSGSSAERTTVFEVSTRFDDEDTLFATSSCVVDDDEMSGFDIDVDVDFSEDEDTVAVEEAPGLELDDVEIDFDDDVTADEIAGEAEEAEASKLEVAAEPTPEPIEVEKASDIDPAVAEVAASEPAPMDAGESFDLREALADVLTEYDGSTAAPRADSGFLSTVEDGFESIFSDFKKGVSATLEVGDFDTRYDLGIAYREMGLFEDAIGEFRVCLESPTRRFDSAYLMGLCARDLGRFADSVNHLKQALALPDLSEERMAGVYFDLSIAEELAGNLDRACSSVRRVIELEADFPGAAARLTALESGAAATPELGEPGEVFESFDDLFEDDEDDADSDGAVAESITVETFESFDDLVSEAEAVPDDVELGRAPKAKAEVVEGNERTKTVPRKRGRKKISFV